MTKQSFCRAMATVACSGACLVTISASAADAPGSASAEHPTKHFFEAGVFGGVLFPSSEHSLSHESPQPFETPIPELGARAAYFPIGFFGIEGELGAGWAKTESGEKGALWGARAHLLGQLPHRWVSPFVLLGGGRLGAARAGDDDDDPSLHFGGGLKLSLDDFVAARVDVRDHLTRRASADSGFGAHHPEVTLGLAFTLDMRSASPPPPPDSDSDGIPDGADQCPQAAGPAPLGCPSPPDSDLDGLEDSRDGCPSEAGPAPTGCPDKDPDHDCVPLPQDRCPDQAGLAPDGCPDPDPDGDGIEGASDQCPGQPETRNNFEDTDGCPDTLPEKVEKFSGVIAGIEFDSGKATIRPGSRKILDEAAGVLKEYPALRIAVIGHTDSVGGQDKNVALSRDRAEAVKAYLVSQGVGAARIDAVGMGPDQPIADNQSAEGRQKNRRIEFKLVQ